VSVQVRHFSQWYLYVLGPGDVHATSAHFTFRFPAAINVSAWGTTDPFQVMARVRAKLEAFHDAYVTAGFAAPTHKVPVRLKEVLESAYDPLSGDITVSSFNYGAGDARLEHELAHELFHAFQGAQLNLFSLDARRWFVEAAADYAADALASHSGLMGSKIQPTWSWLPLGLLDDNHEYATSHLLAWLAARGKGLKDLQDAVFGALLTTDTGEAAFAKAAAGAGGFARTFVEYIVWLETDARSPLAAQPVAGLSITDSFSADSIRLDLLSSTTPEPRAYTAAWSPGTERELVWDTPPAGVELEVRVLRGGARGSAETPLGRYATLAAGDAILFVLAGEAAATGGFTVRLDPVQNATFFSVPRVSGPALGDTSGCSYQ